MYNYESQNPTILWVFWANGRSSGKEVWVRLIWSNGCNVGFQSLQFKTALGPCSRWCTGGDFVLLLSWRLYNRSMLNFDELARICLTLFTSEPVSARLEQLRSMSSMYRRKVVGGVRFLWLQLSMCIAQSITCCKPHSHSPQTFGSSIASAPKLAQLPS